jgi:hypothetical protein
MTIRPPSARTLNGATGESSSTSVAGWFFQIEGMTPSRSFTLRPWRVPLISVA